jgi:hypothetical protein
MYESRLKDAMEAAKADHERRDLPNTFMLNEALCRSLPHAPVSLQRAVTKHKDAMGRPLWQEAIFAVHIQDNRLTEKERQVIAAIGRRLYGSRSIV